jgi:nucleoside phosphorylase
MSRKGQFAAGAFTGAKIGAVQTKTVNMGGKPASKQKKAKTAALPLVLVVCAKYHETDVVEDCARGFAVHFEEVPKPVRHFLAKTAQYELVLVSVDTQGPTPTASFMSGPLAFFKPNYVTMIGCCGARDGYEARLKTAFACTTAIMMDHSNPSRRRIFTADPQFRLPEAWLKTLPREIPVEVGEMFTSHTIEESPHDRLEQHNSHGLEMEAAAVWSAVDDYRSFNKEPEIFKLPIFKGWSDCGGGKVQRDANKKDATRNAAKALKSYLDFLLN